MLSHQQIVKGIKLQNQPLCLCLHQILDKQVVERVITRYVISEAAQGVRCAIAANHYGLLPENVSEFFANLLQMTIWLSCTWKHTLLGLAEHDSEVHGRLQFHTICDIELHMRWQYAHCALPRTIFVLYGIHTPSYIQGANDVDF